MLYSEKEEIVKRELKKDLETVCPCECCGLRDSNILYVPIIDNAIVVAHICLTCFKEFEEKENVYVFNKF